MDKKQKTANTEFLDTWRELEVALRDNGPCTVQDLENNLAAQGRDADASKLRISRQTRNFLIHDGQGFIAAAPAMTDFLSGLIYEVKCHRGTVKDAMLSIARYGTAATDARIMDAAKTMLAKKRQDLVVTDGAGAFAGIFGAKAMALALFHGACTDSILFLADKNALDMSVTAICDTTPVQDAPKTKCVVVNARGKCVGVLNPGTGWT